MAAHVVTEMGKVVGFVLGKAGESVGCGEGLK